MRKGGSELDPLRSDQELSSLAEGHSNDMASMDSEEHGEEILNTDYFTG
jgi:uncharacterized protein YkwD